MAAMRRADTLEWSANERMPQDTYEHLIGLLNEHKAQYRLIDHPVEGRTEIVSPRRGNQLEQAAKCMVIMVKLGRKTTKYILAVVETCAWTSMP